MDDAIKLKTSRIELSLDVLVSGLSLYSLYVAQAPIDIKLSIISALIFLVLLLSYKNKGSKQVVGKIHCEEQGVYLITANDITHYECRLVQRLPWCLLIEFYSENIGAFKKIIWVDALTTEHWRALRTYLNR